MGPSHFVTVPAVLEEDNGQEVETGSMLQILLVDFGIGILPFLREFDLVTVAMESQPFSADGVDFLPLSSSLLTSALEWLQVASKNRPSFIPLQRKPSQLPRQSRRLHVLLPKRPAQRRRTTAALADSPSVPQCLPYRPCLSPSFSVQLVHLLPDHGL